MTTPPPTLELLSTEMREVARLIGPDALAELLIAYGGRWPHIPKSAPAGSKLTSLIGAERARNLCDFYGGDKLYFPKSDAWLIRHLAARGYSNDKIAERLRCAVITVRRRLNPAQTAQLDFPF